VTTPLTNAERQRRRRKLGPRPPLQVTVSRWVQAELDAVANTYDRSLSKEVEMALDQYIGHTTAARLTERGAALLGQCTACKRKLVPGDWVRRDGEFAKHKACP
jgi:hypothetical protein